MRAYTKTDYEALCKKYFPHLKIVEDFTKGIHSDISLDERSEMSQVDLLQIEKEEQEYFAKSRRKDCFGGSDIASIFGRGYFPPSVLARQKQSVYSPKAANNELLVTGHRAETPIRNAFERVSGLTTTQWPLTMVNPKWPHFRMNIDGLVFENGNGFEDGTPGIYEGKWTSSEGSMKREHYKPMKKFNALGKDAPLSLCPEKFLFQIWGYEAGMEIDFGYLCGGWGYSDEEIGFVRVPRLPREDEEYLLQTCEEFMQIVNDGGLPSDDIFVNKVKLLEFYKDMATEIPHSKNHAKLDPEDYKNAKRVLELEKEVENLNKQLVKEIERFKELWIEEHGLDQMKEEKDALQTHFQEELMEKSEGIVKDGNKAIKLTYNEEEGRRSFRKDLCQEKYPEIFDEIYNSPKERVLRIKELPKGRLVKR